jgi:hypothetical protein
MVTLKSSELSEEEAYSMLPKGEAHQWLLFIGEAKTGLARAFATLSPSETRDAGSNATMYLKLLLMSSVQYTPLLDESHPTSSPARLPPPLGFIATMQMRSVGNMCAGEGKPN